MSSLADPNTPSPSSRVNMDEVVNSWSPEDVRKQLDDTGHGNMKVRSLNGNTRRLRGGDWITSGPGFCTLAVAWKEHGGKQYGLTVAHVFTSYNLPRGSSVWAVDSDEPLPATGKHRTIKIGSLVSIDFATDSAVFEIFPNIKIDPLAVALSSGDDKVVKIKRPSPFTPIPEEVPYGSQLIIYGAARRGMIGVRVPRRGENVCDMSAFWSTQSYDNEGSMEPTGQTKLTFSGDCGALAIDAQGRPWSMHTTIQGVPANNPTTWTSHGAMFCKVVDAHAFYFGHTPNVGGSNSSSHSQQSSPASISSEGLAFSISLTGCFDPKAGRVLQVEFENEAPGGAFFRGVCPASRIPVEFEDDNDGTDEKKTESN